MMMLTIGCHDDDSAVGGDDVDESTDAHSWPGVEVDGVEHIENFFQISERFYSGGQPQGEAAFAELAARDIKVIISVDGARPNLELAEKHGLRYIHIPIGYDGIHAEDQLKLVKAMQFTDQSIFIHCHHGKHRGPAAAAMCMMGDEHSWTNAQAAAFLEQAGTSRDYVGLYRDVAAFEKPDSDALASIPDDLPEYVVVSDMVEAMANIDRHWSYLKAFNRNEFKGLPDHPDVVPAQEALIVAEGLRELVRQPETKDKGNEFFDLMKASEDAAWNAHEVLKNIDAADELTYDAAKSAYTILADTCKACHKKYRN